MTRQSLVLNSGLELMKDINFLGLAFEEGQERSGLKDSHEYVRQYFPFLRNQGIRLHDRGAIWSPGLQGAKVRSQASVPAFQWVPYKQAFEKIQTLLQEPQILLNWGGDHSVALATVGAFCAQNPEGFVVWIDAHADINLPEHSLSGNLHGMPLSILLNVNEIADHHFPWLKNHLRPDRIIYVGVRDLDPFEKEIVQSLGIQTFTTEDVRTRGMEAIAEEILLRVQNHPLHVSFDIDSLSPEVAPATGVPVSEGLSLADVRMLGAVLSAHERLCSVDVVEINPALGNADEVLRTYFAAFSFLMSIFHQGEIYDGIRRPGQTNHTASLESSSQV